VINCYRYLGYHDINQVNRLTLYDYSLKMKAYSLQVVDKQYYMHLQSWLDQQVQATKGEGRNQKPYYKKFKEFFDYEKAERDVRGEDYTYEETSDKTDYEKKLKELMLKANT